MALPNNPPPGKKNSPDYPVRVLAVGGEIGCITLGIVLASVFGGLWLDRLLGTKPVITFILVFLSAPVALYLTYRLAMRMVKDSSINQPSVRGTKTNITKEEDDR